MRKDSRIFVAGHRGLVGSAIVRELERQGYCNILTATRAQCDLSDFRSVIHYFEHVEPTHVFLAAAKVGGITANNTFPADFILENLKIQTAVLEASKLAMVNKLLFLGSSCIYPKLCPQPIKEEYLMTGALEPTNDAYAIAKIAGIKMCDAYRAQYGCNFISAMPTNLYGPGDNFHKAYSHAIPQIMRKFHEAKLVDLSEVRGFTDGSPLREFLYVDDLAKACVHLMHHYREAGPINVGTGVDCTMRATIELIAQIVGYTGRIVFDGNIPNGTPRKVLDVSRIHALGWKHEVSLEDGLRKTYDWFLSAEDKRM
ncbi:GDP-fucose synthetase [Candidatus Kaiserbacteria bacterium RIFCSPHIGHO2_02_FULL_50_50]|uniref:GDP-L-fucose synthase n=1 Tax=Candidatus Kaiserbacteria bacterium RIFCSPHIGHO2_02_FULL_50_50 TaxID=1798492 RepID=A0A1F6DCM8_9BACT|nr:MAG: GDP-fucose synthetase [Candidatus Kaiserbacteria bacterium RIFCSPHIGHO2_02_FULL_50_50]OGG88154.1 MAG: GDP-fucose synthetase [Candidatus Kaiserbacteria bacterium RIFCSPLOWO2_12_FULL_50_10]